MVCCIPHIAGLLASFRTFQIRWIEEYYTARSVKILRHVVLVELNWHLSARGGTNCKCRAWNAVLPLTFLGPFSTRFCLRKRLFYCKDLGNNSNMSITNPLQIVQLRRHVSIVKRPEFKCGHLSFERHFQSNNQHIES
jgi:hypothetical protein